MQPLDEILLEVDALERSLGRRGFLKAIALLPVVPAALSHDDRQFLERTARVLIPAEALQRTAVDVVTNVEHMLARASAHHRARVVRILRLARRLSFLYGGDQMAVRARASRFVSVRRLARLVSVVCLVAFWGDERTRGLIDDPRVLA